MGWANKILGESGEWSGKGIRKNNKQYEYIHYFPLENEVNSEASTTMGH